MWMVGLVVGKCKDHLIKFQCSNHFLVLKYANIWAGEEATIETGPKFALLPVVVTHHVNHPRVGSWGRNWPAPTLGHESQNSCNQSCFAVLMIEHCLICLDFDGASVDMVWNRPVSKRIGSPKLPCSFKDPIHSS